MGQAVDRIGTLGILGGGQLARMTAVAARRLGHATHVQDPARDCPASTVVEKVVVAPLDSVEHALDLAHESDVVTVDTEHVPAHVLEAVATRTAMHPGAHVLEVIQDRSAQKSWLARHGYPVGPFRATRSEGELEAAFAQLPGRLYVKRTREGYDGRGQRVYDEPRSARRAREELGTAELLVECAVPLSAELSVLVARGVTGEIAVYPPSRNHHERGVLQWSQFPASLPSDVAQRARELAASVAVDLRVCGLLCVELFLSESGDLLINELAPRPHNSYHHTELGCVTSQFEQLVRAVCGLPLGSVEVTRPAAIYNLLGDIWTLGAPLDFRAALSMPGVTAQLYGKHDARPGRKMGHLTATGATPERALERVLQARELLCRSSTPFHEGES